MRRVLHCVMSPMRAVGEQVTLIEGSSEGYSQPAFMGVAAVFALPGVFRLSLLLSLFKNLASKSLSSTIRAFDTRDRCCMQDRKQKSRRQSRDPSEGQTANHFSRIVISLPCT